MYIQRNIETAIATSFSHIPVTAIIGARQVGKSTLAKHLLRQAGNFVYIDLETEKDRQLLREPYLFFELNRDKIICLDEIQMMQSIFPEIRSFSDAYPETKFLLLGSSSPELLKHTAESLAGRIFYYELTPFLWNEIVSSTNNLQIYWLKGGFPRSFLSENEKVSFLWLENYIKTFLEKDVRYFLNVSPEIIRRLWIMLAHINGQELNYSKLSNSLGVSSPTVKNYIDILEYTFMIRRLQPFYLNIKKRLVKSPKIYFRDCGILHALLKIHSYDELFTHPVYGTSWEALVIENLIHHYNDYEPFFYKTAQGAEIDLLLVKGNKKIAFEIKASSTPKISKGFFTAVNDLQADEAYVIAQNETPFPLKNNITVYPFQTFMKKLTV